MPISKWKMARRWLLRSVFVSLIIFAAASWVVGGKLIAPVNQAIGPPPEDLELLIKQIVIGSKTGKVAGWHLEHESASATIALFHPVRANRTSMLGRARLLFEAGYDVILIDLQAHGESLGENITFGFREKENVRSTVEFVRSAKPEHKIGVVGWSLGGAAAVLAGPMGVDAMVLESVYPTAERAIYNRVGMRVGPLKYIIAPTLLWQLKPRLGVTASDLCPVDRIAKIGCPVLIIGGDKDTHTTKAETDLMFEAAVEPKRHSIFIGAAHEDLLAKSPDNYASQVLEFFESNLKSD